jgi:hypothetical protein
MRCLTLLDVLFDEWLAADQAASVAWGRVSSPRHPPKAYGSDVMTAMRLQIEADELVEAMLVELRKERRQLGLI